MRDLHRPTTCLLLGAWLTLGLAAATGAQSPSAPASASPREPVSVQVGSRPWTGDLEAMAKRRLVRVLVPFSKTFYYVEKGRARGVSAEIVEALEIDLNRERKTTKALRIHVVPYPVARDELQPMLVEGRGDVVIADLTVTPERQKIVDFSAPMFRGIAEVVVTGPAGGGIASIDALSGKEVFVRRSTSYWEHLEALNQRLLAAGKPPVTLREAPDELEAEDILEMVNAGLVEATVVDGYKAKMWQPVFPKITINRTARLNEDGEYAFAIRQGSPGLKAALDGFVGRHAQGTAFGNTIIKRYSKDPKFVKNAAGDDERRRFGATVELFRKYGDRYDMDHLLMMAQGFQESGLDQSVRSRVGAIGVMQIMPATGRDLNVGDISQLENNVHAGVKYMRFMMDQYFKDEPMTPLNKGLFTFAAYNCGPGRVAQLRKEAAKRGLDPNRWFNNVELVAADRIGPETVAYVSNIYKYYTAYTLIEQQNAQRRKARETLGAPPK